MNIFKFDFNLHLNSFDFYLSGCNPPHCKNCHNSELFDFSKGTDYKLFLNQNWRKLTTRSEYVSNIMIFGGEPLDQNTNDLEDFLEILLLFKKPIWLFTKYSLIEVPLSIIKYLNYIKVGRFDHTLPPKLIKEYNLTLGSQNQEIIKLS